MLLVKELLLAEVLEMILAAGGVEIVKLMDSQTHEDMTFGRLDNQFLKKYVTNVDWLAPRAWIAVERYQDPSTCSSTSRPT